MPRVLLPFTLSLACALALTRCGGTSESHDADCAAICEKELALGCPNFQTDQQTCTAQCQAEAASCADSQVVSSYLTCLLDKPLECGQYSGSITSPDCLSQAGAFLACTLKPGGDAGTAIGVDGGTRTPVQVAPAQGYVATLTVEGDQPFWIDGANIVTSVDGAAKTLYTHVGGNDQLSSLGLDATDLYFTVNVGYGVSGNLQRVARAGGAATTLFTEGAALSLLRLTADTIWARSTYLKPDGTAGGLVLKGPKAGPLVEVARSPDQILDVQPTTTGFYFSDERSLWRVEGAAAPVLVDGAKNVSPRELAADATTLFWTVSAAHEIASMPLTGGVPTEIIRSLPEHPYGLALDGATLYLRLANGGLARVPAAGGAVEYLLITGKPVDEFTGFALGQSAAFFSRQGAIWRVAK